MYIKRHVGSCITLYSVLHVLHRMSGLTPCELQLHCMSGLTHCELHECIIYCLSGLK